MDGAKRKIERGRDEESLWKKKGCHATWSHHLKCSHTQDKTHYENSQVSHKHSCKVFYYPNSMCKYMEGDTLYKGRIDLGSKMREG